MWLEQRIGGGYGAGHLQARRGELIDVLAGDGLVAEAGGEAVGVVLWRTDADGTTELTYLWAFEPDRRTGFHTGAGDVAGRWRLPIWVVTTTTTSTPSASTSASGSGSAISRRGRSTRPAAS